MQPAGIPPLPPPLPVTIAAAGVKPSATTKWLLVTVASLVALLVGLLTLALLGSSTGLVGLMFGMVLAVLPLPIYLLLALWIDRFEKEPVWMLASAFIWGATVSVFFAFILNTTFGLVAASVVGGLAEMATTVVSAPVVEELAKGFALLIFYLWKKDEFDNVLDGIIYAAMVGLGFAMTENILYYGNAVAEGGLGASMVTFILRGVVSPFAHPLFTSMTGIGLGLARQAPPGSSLKFWGPVGGLCLAMFLHFLWNFSASFGAMFFIAYVVIMVPAFLGLITLVIISLRKEGRIIREHLLPELRSGLLPQPEYDALCTVGGRMGAARQAFGRGGREQRKARRRLQDLASELAFHRWRTARGIFPRSETPAAREAGYVAQLHAIAAQLGWKPAAIAAGGWTPPPLPVAPATSPAAAPKVVRAPRTGGVAGMAIAVGSLGCLGAVALSVIGLGVLLYAAGHPGGSGAPVVQANEVLEGRPLTSLFPDKLGGLQRDDVTAFDPEGLTMLGAVDGQVGSYGGNMNLLLLRYRSPELAAGAIEPLRAAMFSEGDGWQVATAPLRGPAHRLNAEQSETDMTVSVWNYGSLVMIFWGNAAQMSKFTAPSEILSHATR